MTANEPTTYGVGAAMIAGKALDRLNKVVAVAQNLYEEFMERADAEAKHELAVKAYNNAK